jgi:hypothetical protein
MTGVLKISCTYEDSISQFLIIQFLIVTAGNNFVLHFLFPLGGTLFPSATPDIRNGDDIKIQFLVMIHEAGHMRGPVAIGKPDNSHPHPIVGTQYPPVAGSGKAGFG